MKHKAITLWAAVGVLFGVCLAPLPSSAHEGSSPYWGLIKEKGKLVIAIQENYPPFSMKNKKGEYIGYDVEIARRICRTLGVKPEFKAIPLKQVIPALAEGKVDLALAAMTITPKRARMVHFSEPYMLVSQGAVLDKRFLPDGGVERDIDNVSVKYSTYFDLKKVPDLTIAVKEASVPEAHARRSFPEATLVPQADALAAMKALLDGKAKAMVHDAPFIKVWLATHGLSRFRLHPLLKPAINDGLGIAIRKGDLDFLRWLDTFVQCLRRSGVLTRLEREYFEELSWRSEVEQ